MPVVYGVCAEGTSITFNFQLLPAIEDAENDDLLRIVFHHESDADATLEADHAQTPPNFVAQAPAFRKGSKSVEISKDAIDVAPRRDRRRSAIH